MWANIPIHHFYLMKLREGDIVIMSLFSRPDWSHQSVLDIYSFNYCHQCPCLYFLNILGELHRLLMIVVRGNLQRLVQTEYCPFMFSAMGFLQPFETRDSTWLRWVTFAALKVLLYNWCKRSELELHYIFPTFPPILCVDFSKYGVESRFFPWNEPYFPDWIYSAISF